MIKKGRKMKRCLSFDRITGWLAILIRKINFFFCIYKLAATIAIQETVRKLQLMPQVIDVHKELKLFENMRLKTCRKKCDIISTSSEFYYLLFKRRNLILTAISGLFWKEISSEKENQFEIKSHWFSSQSYSNCVTINDDF